MKFGQFPKTLYVRLEKDQDNVFAVAEESVAQVVDVDGPTTIGVYKLVDTMTARKVVETTSGKKARK